MIILGTILSLRASGSNVFCTLNCFLLRLRNAGAYIPKGTPCTLHVSTNLLINVDGDFLSRIHIL